LFHGDPQSFATGADLRKLAHRCAPIAVERSPPYPVDRLSKNGAGEAPSSRLGLTRKWPHCGAIFISPHGAINSVAGTATRRRLRLAVPAKFN
jgi:hypothetical protein